MNKIRPLVSILLLLFFVLHGWFLAAVPVVVYFTYYYSALWLVPVAILIDGYFGAFTSFPKLTFYAALWFVFSELIKPRLVWHNTKYDA